MTPYVSVENLRLARGDAPICEGLSMHLAAHECVHLRGTNGSGKTSLMQVLSGLLRPDAGRVLWHGGAARTDAHYCAHQDGLKAVWTVAENMGWQLRLLGAEVPAHLKQHCLERMQLDHLADTPVAQLSQGQKRRCALLRLQLVPRRVWLLDEPFNALDRDAHECLVAWINEHTRQGGAVLFSSHSERPVTLRLSREITLGPVA